MGSLVRIGAGCWNGLSPLNTGFEASTDGSVVSAVAGVGPGVAVEAVAGVDADGAATAFVAAAPVAF